MIKTNPKVSFNSVVKTTASINIIITYFYKKSRCTTIINFFFLNNLDICSIFLYQIIQSISKFLSGSFWMSDNQFGNFSDLILKKLKVFHFTVTLFHSACQIIVRTRMFWKNILGLNLNSQNFSCKNRPGGIRTHDQKIKSLLRYHCATSLY